MGPEASTRALGWRSGRFSYRGRLNVAAAKLRAVWQTLPLSRRARACRPGLLEAFTDVEFAEACSVSSRLDCDMRLDLFPLNTVLFPGMRLPLHIFEPRYRAMLARCIETEGVFGVVLIAEGDEVGATAIPHRIGTTARVEKVEYLPDGRFNLLALGETRFRIERIVAEEPHVVGEVALAPLPADNEASTLHAADDVRERFERLVTLMIEIQAGYMPDFELPADPMQLAYLIAAGVPTGPASAQRLLEADSLAELLDLEGELIDVRMEQALSRLQQKLDARRN